MDSEELSDQASILSDDDGDKGAEDRHEDMEMMTMDIG